MRLLVIEEISKIESEVVVILDSLQQGTSNIRNIEERRAEIIGNVRKIVLKFSTPWR